MNRRVFALGKLAAYLSVFVALGAVFYLCRLHRYLLFHTTSELISIVVAAAIFVIFWNTRHIVQNGFFLFLGIAYLFVGIIDLVHTLAYEGMGVISVQGANPATQLWIAARYMESISLLLAPFFTKRKLRSWAVLGIYALVTSLVLLSIFSWRIFPECFNEKTGLTPFKVVSEHIIIFILVVTLVFLYFRREAFNKKVLYLFALSVILTIFAEQSFTLYRDVYGHWNFIGHYLKVASFLTVYIAFVEIGLRNPYLILFRDLKEREEALAKSETRYRSLFVNMISGLAYHRIIVDEKNRPIDYVFLETNPKFHEFTGLGKEIIGKKVTEVLPGIRNATPDLIEIYGDVALSGKPVRLEFFFPPLKKYYAISAFSLVPGEFVVAFDDVSERKKAEEQLADYRNTLEILVEERTSELERANKELEEQIAAQRITHIELEQSQKELRVLASRLSNAQEVERRNVATDLHDHVIQLLAAMRIKLGMLRKSTGDERTTKSLRELDQLASDTIKYMRAVIFDLSPTVLYDVGLAAALERLAEDTEARYNVSVKVEDDGHPKSFGRDTDLIIYKSVRELIANAMKHSHSERLLISSTVRNGEAFISVKDNGEGFEVPPDGFHVREDGGFGLFNVNERVTEIGGRLDIQSEPGRGTTATIIVPVQDGSGTKGAWTPWR